MVDMGEINMAKYGSKDERFKRMIETPLGSRVYLPDFGSKLYELIDREVTHKWAMLFKKYIFEAFFNKNWEPWDDDFIPESISLNHIDTTKGEISVSVNFAS